MLFRYIRPILALTITAGCFLFMFTLLYRRVPAENKELAALVAGYVLAVLSMPIGYYFNANKDKTDNAKTKPIV
jgi:uncharacterized BrkB/YihY/UPF0761 family membrane protein